MAFSPSPPVVNADMIPKPAAALPPASALDGTKGISDRYALEDHTHAVLVQRVVLTTDGSGLLTWTYARPIECAKGAVPVISINAEDTGSPIAAQVTGRTFSTNAAGNDVHTAVTVKAQRSQPLPATILTLVSLVSFNIFGVAAAGVKLNLWASPPTQ